MRQRSLCLVLLGTAALFCGAARKGEVEVSPEITGEERRHMPNIWVMDFAYSHPRMITVEIPGKDGKPQRKLIWYLLYRVTNRTGEPRMFVPEFTLVSNTGKAYTDKVIPVAQRAIVAREAPLLPMANSATIGPIIPVSPEEGLDRSTYGVAMWQDVDPTTDKFSVFVTGLSNGYKVIQEEPGRIRVERKTLELKYWRPGDEFFEHEKEIRFEESEWIYR